MTGRSRHVRTWLPKRQFRGGSEAERPHPLVVVGHGGGRSKDAEEIHAVAGAFTKRGCAVLACDWPGHGENAPFPDATPEEILRNSAEEICDPEVWLTAAKEWEVAVDDFVDAHGLGPVGYWGLSLGTVLGLGVAARLRPGAAVLGLAGLVPSLEDQMRSAAGRLRCPLRFLRQTEDELFPQESVAQLLQALAGADLEVRQNTGGHFDVPVPEILGSVIWLAARLAELRAR